MHDENCRSRSIRDLRTAKFTRYANAVDEELRITPYVTSPAPCCINLRYLAHCLGDGLDFGFGIAFVDRDRA